MLRAPPSRPAATADGCPAGCVPAHKTLFIPNVTTDVGLSPPYNSLFTFFGQFFDHGVDQTVKSGGTVFVPLKADDPLITLGPDGIAGTGDEVPPSQALHGADPGPEPARRRRHPRHGRRHPERQQHRLARGSTRARPTPRTPRTRSSCASTTLNAAGQPGRHRQAARWLAPARRTDSPDGHDRHRHLGRGQEAGRRPSSACSSSTRTCTNIPMLAADPYGNFIPGPTGPAAVRDRRPASSRATSAQPGAGAGQRPALRHAVPDRHRAQRRPVARRTPTTTRHAAGGADAGRRQHAVGGLRQPARRHLRRRDAERALHLR